MGKISCDVVFCQVFQLPHYSAAYFAGRYSLVNVSKQKYLGITIDSNLTWAYHVANVCKKATTIKLFVIYLIVLYNFVKLFAFVYCLCCILTLFLHIVCVVFNCYCSWLFLWYLYFVFFLYLYFDLCLFTRGGSRGESKLS